MPASVKKRFLVSLVSNALRAGMSFFTGLIIARGLSPAGYGELSFLLGSFVALRSLLDLGTSNAFYTFIAQEKRPLRYYSWYGLWLAFQFLFTLCAVAFFLPADLRDRLWLGHDRSAILLAFSASFLQQQIWLTVTQIGEAARKTVQVQSLNIALAALYLSSAILLYKYGGISVRSVLALLVLLYLAMSFAGLRVLAPFARQGGGAGEEISPREMFGKYRAYCAPLAMLSAAGFVYDFSDKWLLQHFGGASQQGFYQVAFQFATISVLATTSILNIFWKETAEAVRLNDSERVRSIFRRVSRGLYMFGAVLSGFLIPWSGQVIGALLGRPYSQAGPVLGLMLLYPLHQSLGQVAGTVFLASEKTKQYMAVSLAGMFLSLPISYLLQAPAQGHLIPGLGLGAMGMAVKMVGLNILSVNILLWFIARNHKWKFDYLYQIAGLGIMLTAGWAVKLAAAAVFPGMDSFDRLHLIAPFLISGCLYLVLAGCAIWSLPWLIGMDREEIRRYAGRLGEIIGNRL